MVFLGIPQEKLRYTQLLIKSSAENWPKEDQEMLQKAIKFNIGMKVVGMTGAGGATWATSPALAWPTSPALLWTTILALLPKAMAFVLLFRCMSVPAALHFEKVAQILVIKHDLTSTPPSSPT